MADSPAKAILDTSVYLPYLRKDFEILHLSFLLRPTLHYMSSVGFAAGGPFDVWARLIASHLGRFVPGNPAFVVQNMTGGGSMIRAGLKPAPTKTS